MRAVNVRVEAKDTVQTYENFRGLLGAFRRACIRAGISKDCKRHQEYESPGRKRRRKKREAEIARLKDKLRINLPRKDPMDLV